MTSQLFGTINSRFQQNYLVFKFMTYFQDQQTKLDLISVCKQYSRSL